MQVELVARRGHRQREVGRLLVGHAAEVDRHQQCRGLVVGNRTGSEAVDKEVKLLACQFAAVAF